MFAEIQCLSPQGSRSLIDKNKLKERKREIYHREEMSIHRLNRTEFNLRGITLNDIVSMEGDMLDTWLVILKELRI